MFVNNTQSSVEAVLAVFAGRVGMAGYDASKPMKIAECNRDFVWDSSRKEKLIISVLTSYPIPAITICNGDVIDGGNRLTTLWLFRNGEFTIELNGETLNYETMCQNRTLVRHWDACMIPQTIVTNATPDEISQIYQNLNQGVPLTFGQLLENRRRKAIVDVAMSMLGYSQRELPFRALLDRVWYKPASKPKKTKSRTEIGFAYSTLVSSIMGPAWFNTNIMEHIDYIMSTSDNDLPSFENLEWILRMLDEIDPMNAIPKAKKKDCFKRFIGAIIHDFHTLPRETVHNKWQAFFRDAYNILNKNQLKDLVDVGVKRATNQSRVQQLSVNIQEYLDNRHIVDAAESDSEMDSIEDEEDDE